MGRFEILFEAGIRGPQEVAEAYLDRVMEYLVDQGYRGPVDRSRHRQGGDDSHNRGGKL